MWDEIDSKISEITRHHFVAVKRRSIGGGCINSAYVISDGVRQFFVKTNSASQLEMFDAEQDGLWEIAQSQTIRVPQPVVTGSNHTHSFIVMEYLKLAGKGNANSQIQLAEDLAKMHHIVQPKFGWRRDNTIGSTPQVNELTDNWVDFWRHKRLGFQFELAMRKGFNKRLKSQGDKLLINLNAFFDDVVPQASLLHGDLWSGNYALDESGTPVIFDPATYYGDRETDIAMTELFGGFSADFYMAYNNVFPLHSGYSTRKTLYNLYHILNHLNLFGEGYLSQAQSMVDSLLSKVH